jgi:hypothetical protein
MPLRIGFDMDGVLADFSLAFQEIETRLFGPDAHISADRPETEEESESVGSKQKAVGSADGTENTKGTKTDESEEATGPGPRELRRQRDAIWREIRATPNFWETLRPIEEDAVRRIHEMMLRHRWEVFFITQRPATEGETVQRQTQRWLVEQGFDLPSVLVLGGSRGAAAGALRLNYHVDDSPQNCLDVISESKAKPILILILPDADDKTVASARKLGIGTARTITECLDILEEATVAHTQPGLMARIATLVGWK